MATVESVGVVLVPFLQQQSSIRNTAMTRRNMPAVTPTMIIVSVVVKKGCPPSPENGDH